ncbi:MAG: hypothetical protein ACRC3Y_00460 [Romboutsia sp.]|uniref:hypothetical protein n=1 Tax=Romboutsia sp. TaxID=1965302 RepID=UPI003F3326A1
MKLKKYITTALALTIIFGGVMVNKENSTAYADEFSTNSISDKLENGQAKVQENGDIVIEDENSTLILTLEKISILNKDGSTEKIGASEYSTSEYATTRFQVHLGQTVTKEYSAVLLVNVGYFQKAATADVSIDVKCTGVKQIKATSSVSNLKSYNSFVVQSSKQDGFTSNTSTASATLTGTKGSYRGTQTFSSQSTIVSDSGSAQGYLVTVDQGWV